MNRLARRMATVKALAIELSTDLPFFVVNDVSSSSWNLFNEGKRFLAAAYLRKLINECRPLYHLFAGFACKTCDVANVAEQERQNL